MKVYVILDDRLNDKRFIQVFVDVYFDLEQAQYVLSKLNEKFPKGHFYIKEFTNK